MKNYFPQRGSASKKFRESSREYLPAFTCRWRRTCSIRCLRLPAFGHCFSGTVCLILARRSRNAYWFCKFLLGKLCQATGQWKEKGNRKVYEETNMNCPQSMTSAVSLTLQKLIKNSIFERVFQFLALCSQAPIALDVIAKYVMEMEPDIDEFLTAAEISKCGLLIPDANNPALVRMHRVEHLR